MCRRTHPLHTGAAQGERSVPTRSPRPARVQPPPLSPQTAYQRPEPYPRSPQLYPAPPLSYAYRGESNRQWILAGFASNDIAQCNTFRAGSSEVR